MIALYATIISLALFAVLASFMIRALINQNIRLERQGALGWQVQVEGNFRKEGYWQVSRLAAAVLLLLIILYSVSQPGF